MLQAQAQVCCASCVMGKARVDGALWHRIACQHVSFGLPGWPPLPVPTCECASHSSPPPRGCSVGGSLVEDDLVGLAKELEAKAKVCGLGGVGARAVWPLSVGVNRASVETGLPAELPAPAVVCCSLGDEQVFSPC